MQVAWFIEPLNFRMIWNNLCLMLRLFGVICLAPLVVSLAAGEFIYSAYFGGLVVGTSLLGRLGKKEIELALETKEALALTALVYLIFSLLSAVAFLPAAPFIDGFFESMSGFSTTGLSVMRAETLPVSLLFFRAYSQWIGGAGIVVLSLLILIGPGKTAFKLYTSEFGREKLVGDVRGTTWLVLKFYLVITGLGYLAFIASGMPFFEALLNIMATVSTGGFSSYSNSIGHYQGPAIRFSLIVFMILGAIGFASYYLLWYEGFRRFYRDLQVRYLLVLILLAAVVFAFFWGWTPGKFLDSLFQATTALTTTGFSVRPVEAWPRETKLFSIFLMIIGGSTGSTAGGIKLLRLILMVQLAWWFVLRALLPEEVKLPIKYGKMVIQDQDIKQMTAFFAFYLFFLVVTSLLLVGAGFGITDSFFESASALGTVGLSTGITSPGLSAWAKLLLIFNMWAGRLEILPLLVLFYPGVWVRLGRRKV